MNRFYELWQETAPWSWPVKWLTRLLLVYIAGMSLVGALVAVCVVVALVIVLPVWVVLGALGLT